MCAAADVSCSWCCWRGSCFVTSPSVTALSWLAVFDVRDHALAGIMFNWIMALGGVILLAVALLGLPPFG
jgi:hypothetical protein